MNNFDLVTFTRTVQIQTTATAAKEIYYRQIRFLTIPELINNLIHNNYNNFVIQFRVIQAMVTVCEKDNFANGAYTDANHFFDTKQELKPN